VYLSHIPCTTDSPIQVQQIIGSAQMARDTRNSSIGARTRGKSPAPSKSPAPRKSSVKTSNAQIVSPAVIEAAKKAVKNGKKQDPQPQQQQDEGKTDDKNEKAEACKQQNWLWILITVTVTFWFKRLITSTISPTYGMVGKLLRYLIVELAKEPLEDIIKMSKKVMEEGVTPETRNLIACSCFTLFRVLSLFTWLWIYLFFVRTQFCVTKTETQYIHRGEGLYYWVDEIPSQDIIVGYVDALDFQCKIYLWTILCVDCIMLAIRKIFKHCDDGLLKSICNNLCDYVWLFNAGFFVYYYMNYNPVKAPQGQQYPMCDKLPLGYEHIDKPSYYWVELFIYRSICYLTSFCVPENHSLLMYVVRYYNKGQHDLIMWFLFAY
jgi:hypothetical protein